MVLYRQLCAVLIGVSLALAADLCRAQTGQDEPGDGEVLFKSLKTYELREKLSEIRRRLAEEAQTQATLKEQFTHLLDVIRSAGAEPDGDRQVLTYLDAGRSIRGLLRETSLVGERRRGIQDTVNAARKVLLKLAGEEKPDEKTTAYLTTAERATAELIGELARDQSRLAKLSAEVDRRIRAVPPPESFRNAVGMEFSLVRTGADLAYICPRPVTAKELADYLNTATASANAAGTSPARVDGQAGTTPGLDGPAARVSWDVASDYCRWLGSKDKDTYRLPTVAELEAAHLDMPCAVWTADTTKDPKTDNSTSSRFGVRLASVWDPAQTLRAGTVFSELSFATYDRLGFIIATGPESGTRNRWERLTATAR